MENKLTPELIEKAKQAKTPEELAALAKENGIELTTEEAKAYFAKFNQECGELADDELDDVAGGKKCGTTYDSKGRPVVTHGNRCEHYISAWDGKKETGSGCCGACHYFTTDGWLYLCCCPARVNN